MELAAEAGFDEVTVFASPLSASGLSSIVTPENSARIRAKLAELDLRIANVECFILTPQTVVNNFIPAFELAAELGARGVGVILFDPDEQRVIDNLGRLSGLLEDFPLRAGIEFMGLTPKWKTLREMAALVQQINRDNLGVAVDLLHLIRTGGGPQQIAGNLTTGGVSSSADIDSRWISHVQLCDGASIDVTDDYAREAGGDRLIPGEGVFPIAEFLAALPGDVPLELEVPQLNSAIPDRERLANMMAAMKGLMPG